MDSEPFVVVIESSDTLPTFLAALLGAGVGGILSWILHHIEFTRSRRLEMVKASAPVLAAAEKYRFVPPRKFGRARVRSIDVQRAYLSDLSDEFIRLARPLIGLAPKKSRAALDGEITGCAWLLLELAHKDDDGESVSNYLSWLYSVLTYQQPKRLAEDLRTIRQKAETTWNVTVFGGRPKADVDLPPYVSDNPFMRVKSDFRAQLSEESQA